MTFVKLCGAGIVLGWMAAAAGTAWAQDEEGGEAVETKAASESSATTTTQSGSGTVEVRDRGPRIRPSKWESGLDIRYTQVADISTPMLGAQWLRKLSTDTRIGGSMEALPTSVKKKEDGVTVRANLLAVGLVVEQPLWKEDLKRLSVSLGLGAGRLWVRAEAEGVETEAESVGFNFVEPNVHFLFYNAKHLDMGVMAGARVARINGDDDIVENGDVGGAQLGVTFRHQI